ncbi:MAG TPA: hypothetical protein PK110_04635 [Niabella sp.]|jgi:hypothetical protein|nr:hypothetical protein [Chitinophagaceae bacterium]HRN48972.1 hypothetical protein [Niabella sp.]HRO84090.1 hypothetical protein [Niabella sp.]
MTEIRPKISSYEDLMVEKERLRTNIKYSKADISNSIEGIKDELNPFTGITRKTSELLSVKTSSPLISYGVSNAANFLLHKVILKNAGWLPRLIMPLVVKKVSEFIVAPQLNDKITSGMHQMADSIRNADLEDVLPDEKPRLLQSASEMVSNTGNKIAGKLRTAADSVRPEPVKAAKGHSALARRLYSLAERIRS